MDSPSNTNLPTITPDVMRFEYRQVVGGNALDKPTAGEKFKRFLAKFVSWGSAIGSIVGKFFGPIGMAASAGLYGAKKLADGAVARMDNKRAQDAALDEGSASSQGVEFEAPGFNSFYQQNVAAATLSPSSNTPSVQWAPFTRGLEKEVNSSLSNKSGMTSQLIDRGV
ncbi:MAG: hypothetical protein HQM15_10175 [Deltaproteobacteria bacterium]|nr:hypothetical protein [Deltaproteobacteria bacterium]